MHCLKVRNLVIRLHISLNRRLITSYIYMAIMQKMDFASRIFGCLDVKRINWTIFFFFSFYFYFLLTSLRLNMLRWNFFLHFQNPHISYFFVLYFIFIEDKKTWCSLVLFVTSKIWEFLANHFHVQGKRMPLMLGGCILLWIKILLQYKIFYAFATEHFLRKVVLHVFIYIVSVFAKILWANFFFF